MLVFTPKSRTLMKTRIIVALSCCLGLAVSVHAASPLVLTEFMASNSHTLADEDQQYSDWVEIQNITTNTVNLAGWYLTDSAKNLTKWSFPATNLPPGQFLVVFASAKDRRIPGAPLHTSFRLNATSGYLALVEPDGSTIATEYAPDYPVQIADVSYRLGHRARPFHSSAHQCPGARSGPK